MFNRTTKYMHVWEHASASKNSNFFRYKNITCVRKICSLVHVLYLCSMFVFVVCVWVLLSRATALCAVEYWAVTGNCVLVCSKSGGGFTVSFPSHIILFVVATSDLLRSFIKEANGCVLSHFKSLDCQRTLVCRLYYLRCLLLRTYVLI